jgi:predicted RNase H-like nuclease (RuvC/YqgF family)
MTFTEKIKALEEKKKDYYSKVRSLDKEIEELKRKRKKVCRHPRTKIVTDSYFEPGKMNSPVTWKEKRCAVCNKKLAYTSSETKETWHKT